MTQKKKLLLVTCSFPPEPIVAAGISEAIANKLSQEFEVRVVCPPPTRPLGMNFSKRNDAEHLPYKIEEIHSFSSPVPSISGRLKESFFFGKEIARYIHDHRNEIDVIYAYPWPIASLYMLLRQAEKENIPVIVHIQDLYPESLLGKMGILGKMAKPFLVRYDKKHIHSSDRFIAISPQMKSTLVKTRGIPRENIVMVRNWQDFSLFKGVENIFPNRFTLMFIGSLSPSANIPMLIRAFVNADIPGSRFVIGGSGSQKEELVALAATFPHADIEFIDVTPETTPIVQSKASVLVFGLKKNVAMTATPSKLVAYMYSGKPVIGSVDLGSDSDMIIQESDGGEVVDAEDEWGLAMLMRKYSRKSIAELREIGRLGQLYAIHNFEKETNLSLINTTIRDMIKPKGN